MKMFNEFLNENNNWYDIDNKLYLLKSYYHILDNNDIRKTDKVNSDVEVDNAQNEFAKHYFMLLHNFLIVERMFYDDVVASGKEIYKYLELEPLKTTKEIHTRFLELYDVHHIVRNHIETFDSVEPIRKYLENNRHLYREFLKS